MQRNEEEFCEKLQRYMDARLPIIYVDTLEDDVAEQIIARIAREENRQLLVWDRVNRFRNLTESINTSMSLAETLAFLSKKALPPQRLELENTLFIIRDAAPFLQSDMWQSDENKMTVVSYLKFFAQQINLNAIEGGGIEDCTIVILSPLVAIPRELSNYVTVLEFAPMQQQDIKEMITTLVKEQGCTPLHPDFLDTLAMNLKGLSKTEIFNILELALSDDGEINQDDLPLILEQKQQAIRKSGILEIVKVKETLDDIGGLEALKNWLLRKRKVFQNVKKAEEFGVAIPKGVLIVGIPGCGKSMTAKAVANAFQVPLLRMDMGRLMGKYVGESEGNMRRAIQITEASAPCVLWIDELEKAFAGINGGGSEVATRLFGNFLTWLQEKESLAFVVATANDISKLPPELLRKGRFDEIFYVDLPDKAEREKIFELHIARHHKADLQDINLGKLALESGGYCGADIESIVNDGIEDAFVAGRERIATDDILMAMKQTHPIAETMKDSIKKMQETYKERHFKRASI